MSKDPLPRPVLDAKKRTKYPVDENHGLWQFFNSKRTTLNTPEQDHAHGSSDPEGTIDLADPGFRTP